MLENETTSWCEQHTTPLYTKVLQIQNNFSIQPFFWHNMKTRDVEAVIFQPLPLPHLSHPLPLTKNKKTTVDNFFNFCGSVTCLLLHFIIFRRQKPSFTAITFPASLELIVPNYSVFLFLFCLFFFLLTTLFLHIRTRVECRTMIFNRLVIAEPLMYFRVCHGTPTNKNLEITNCLQENQICRYYNSKTN